VSDPDCIPPSEKTEQALENAGPVQTFHSELGSRFTRQTPKPDGCDGTQL